MLTNSRGVEFVLFSDAQLPGPLRLLGEILIVPCFEPMDLPNGRPGDARAMAMSHRGVYIYDGWVPIQDWTSDELDQVTADLDHVASLFPILGSWYAHWDPKYSRHKPPVKFTQASPRHIRSLSSTAAALKKLECRDRLALTRSAAWIAAALKQDTAIQRFLLLFLSIEALATYIEREAEDTSPLSSLSVPRIGKSDLAAKRNQCIQETLDRLLEVDPAKAISTAYFECVTGTKAMLRQHIRNVFRDETIATRLVDPTPDGRSLWDLRSEIAHGRLHLLREEELSTIDRSVLPLEEIARDYLRRVLAALPGVDDFPPVPRPGFIFTPVHAEGGEGTEYAGPTDMAEYYANVEIFRTSFVRITFDK